MPEESPEASSQTSAADRVLSVTEAHIAPIASIMGFAGLFGCTFATLTGTLVPVFLWPLVGSVAVIGTVGWTRRRPYTSLERFDTRRVVVFRVKESSFHDERVHVLNAEDLSTESSRLATGQTSHGERVYIQTLKILNRGKELCTWYPDEFPGLVSRASAFIDAAKTADERSNDPLETLRSKGIDVRSAIEQQLVVIRLRTRVSRDESSESSDADASDPHATYGAIITLLDYAGELAPVAEMLFPRTHKEAAVGIQTALLQSGRCIHREHVDGQRVQNHDPSDIEEGYRAKPAQARVSDEVGARTRSLLETRAPLPPGATLISETLEVFELGFAFAKNEAGREFISAHSEGLALTRPTATSPWVRFQIRADSWLGWPPDRDGGSRLHGRL